MFRDRTNLFLSYRRTYPHHSRVSRFDSLGEEEEGLIGTSTKNIEMTSLPPSFLEIGEEIDELVVQITKQTEKLNGLYKKNLLPGFNDRTTDEEEIQKLNYEITSKFLRCQNSVKKFETLKRDERLKIDDVNLIDNMQKNYALTIQQLSSNFRKLQNNYIKFLKKDEFEDTPKLKLSSTTDHSYNPAVDEEDTEQMESYSREAIKESSTILQQSTNINNSIIRQREQEITKLAQGVLEVSSIFKDMQNMVIEQGTVLDRIDYNIENTRVELKQANQELTRATHYQKRTQKCKIILLLSLVVLLLFVIVVTKPYRHVPGTGGSGNSNNDNSNDNSQPQPPTDNDASDSVDIQVDDPTMSNAQLFL